MNISTEKFSKKINEIINKISNKEKGKIKEIAKILSKKYLEGSHLYIFGTGHNHCIAEESLHRAGAFAGVTPILDTEVSPNPNDVGMYIVFVEVENEDLMKTTLNLINDIRGLVKVKEWAIKFYKREAINVKTEEIKEWLKKNR